MSIRNRLFGLALGATAVTASLGVAAPAHAQTGFDRCPDDHICLFDQTNGFGEMQAFRIGAPDLRWVGFDKSTQSVWNRSGHDVTAYDDYGYRGTTTHFSPGERRYGPAGFFDLRTISSLTVEVESAWYDRCPVGTLCLFDQPNGEGHMTVVRSDIPDIGATRIDGNPVSMWNRTGRPVAFYDHTWYSGNSTTFSDSKKRSGSPVHLNTRSIRIL